MSTALLRQATVAAARQSSRVRAFSSTAAKKDLVQNIYVSAIKAYKPTPVAKDAHVGVVKQFSLPPAPKTPAVPADLASELQAYDASEPAVGTATTTTGGGGGGAASQEEGGSGAQEFLSFLEQDLPKVEHGHH